MISNFFYSQNWEIVDKFFRNPYLVDLEEFVGGGAGHDWVSKAGRAEQNTYMGPYEKLSRQFTLEPKMMEVLADNFSRLTILAGVERLLTLRQAYGGLKLRFTFADSNTACLQQIFNQGTFTGYFRGSIINAVQFLSTWAHPLFYSQNKGYIAHFVFSSIFEAFTYPLDTIKTILYADVRGQYKGAFDVIDQVYNKNGLSHFWQGMMFKLAFNGALIFHLRNIYEGDTLGQLISLPTLALGYGLLTFKTRQQISGTALSFLEPNQKNKIIANIKYQKSPFSIFRGLLPFLVLTDFFHYNLYALYSKNAQDKVLHEILETAKEKLRSPKTESLWE